MACGDTLAYITLYHLYIELTPR